MNAASFHSELKEELQSILHYWMLHMPDPRGGFWGRIDPKDQPDPAAPKGLVLNSRILWTFSAAWHDTGDSAYWPYAHKAFEYLCDHFLDRKHGGAFWSLDAEGNPLNDRKQIYGLAFAIYGLSEYYKATGWLTALSEAITLFRLIEQHSFDPIHKGYKEAFTIDWEPIEDRRLSEKDGNEEKTMNTHLHILEAYTSLYHIWPEPLLLQRIKDLLHVFEKYIIDKKTGHLGLFFDTNWQCQSNIDSYGHDIEAAWLLQEAATVTNDKAWVDKTRQLGIGIANAALEGLDKDGGLWYEKDGDHLIKEKHWWPQAEAIVGFLHTWQITGDLQWWQRSLDSWRFIKEHIKDKKAGEWYWGIRADYTTMPDQDKAGFWKCPYHNGRACLEVIRRLGS